MGRISVDRHFALKAEIAAFRSTCERGSVGCVIVVNNRDVASGYNGAPSKQPHCDVVGHNIVNGRCTNALHAEMNALAQLTMYGPSSIGSTLYVTHLPCPNCARLIVACEVSRVVYWRDYHDSDADIYLPNNGVQLDKLEFAPAEWESISSVRNVWKP